MNPSNSFPEGKETFDGIHSITNVGENKQIFYNTFHIRQNNSTNNTGWAKSNMTKNKIEYLHCSSAKRANFFTKDRAMFTLQIHTDKASEDLC